MTREMGEHGVGDVVDLPDEVVQSMIDLGYAAEVNEDEQPEETNDPADQVDSKALDKLAESFAKKLDAKLVKTAETALTKKSFTVPAQANDPKHGFKNIGDFARCIAAEKWGDRSASQRLQPFKIKSPTGEQEGNNALGGYAVVPEWVDQIWAKAHYGPVLKDLTDRGTVSGNTLNVPSENETSRADGQRWGGVLGYWAAEGAPLTGSTAGLTQTQLVLSKLAVFVFATNELLMDAKYDMENYISERAGKELVFQTNEAIINGSGTGQPLGILNERSLVTVAKESGQSAASIVFPNLVKMYGQLHYPSRANAVFLVNQEVHQQLFQMTFPNAAGTYPAFGGITFNAHDEFPLRALGLPIITCEQCSALGAAGDIILTDLSQTKLIEKELAMAVSTDFHFNQDETVFRFLYRVDARSPWTSSLTPYAGSKPMSPYICVASRGT